MRILFKILFLSLLFMAINVYAQNDRKEFTYDSKGKRDPLMPLADAKGNIASFSSFRPSGDLYLQGIAYAGEAKNRYAVINSQIIREGDLVNEYKVTKIMLDKVVLSKDGSELILELENNREETHGQDEKK